MENMKGERLKTATSNRIERRKTLGNTNTKQNLETRNPRLETRNPNLEIKPRNGK